MAGPSRKLLGVDFTKIDTAQSHEAGLKVIADNGIVYKYVKANGSIAQYDAVTYTATPNEVISTSAVNTTLAGVNQLSGVLTTNWFWLAVEGAGLVVKAATVVAGTQLVPTATAGTLDDTAAAVGNALAQGSGVGVYAQTADGTPAAGQATVTLT